MPRPRSCRPFLEPLEDRNLPSVYIVNTTKDLLHDTTPGEVTLRDVLTAIDTQASSGNAAAGTASNTIKFAIGAARSTQTIQVGSGNVAAALPALTHAAFIDGWSQGGAGYNGPPLTVLNGMAARQVANGLELDAGSSGSTVRGLVIQQFSGNGITIDNSNSNLIAGNYIGTNSTGTTILGNGNDGVLITDGAHGNTVGGTTVTAGNVLAGNVTGVELSGSGTGNNVLEGNHIGTDRHNTLNLANSLAGVLLQNGASGNTIGGTTSGTGNAIAFNGKGVVIGSSGSDTTTIHDTILGNRIFANTGLGIDLANDDFVFNSTNPRAFPNNGQNAPEITGLSLHSVSVDLFSGNNTTYRVELYATPVSSTANQGQTLLRAFNITTDQFGFASFTTPVSTLPARNMFTATATNLTTGDTSEFSRAATQVLITSAPVIPSRSVAQVVTLTAQVFFGNQPDTTGEVTFTIAGLPGQVTGTPNANGIVTVQFTIPANTPPGQYAITAMLPESEENPSGAASTGVLTITPGKVGRRWLR
jgi:hypothetical protein